MLHGSFDQFGGNITNFHDNLSHILNNRDCSEKNWKWLLEVKRELGISRFHYPHGFTFCIRFHLCKKKKDLTGIGQRPKDFSHL